RQAIGGAGRGDRAGRAIVQTYLPEHPVIRAVASGDASVFYREELAARRAFGSPPFGALVKLTVALEDRAATEAEGRRLASALRERAAAAGSGVGVSPWSCAAAIRWPRWAATRARHGAWTSTPRACSERGSPYTPGHERPPHRHPRRPAPAPQGPARGQLRQVPPRAARRPDRDDAQRAGRATAPPATGRGAAGVRRRDRGSASRAGQPAHRPRRRRRSRPGGLPLDPGLRGLRDAPREGLGGRAEPLRAEDQGGRQRPPLAGPAARAGPSRGQALHRLPRLPRGPDPGGAGAGRRRRGGRGALAAGRVIVRRPPVFLESGPLSARV